MSIMTKDEKETETMTEQHITIRLTPCDIYVLKRISGQTSYDAEETASALLSLALREYQESQDRDDESLFSAINDYDPLGAPNNE